MSRTKAVLNVIFLLGLGRASTNNRRGRHLGRHGKTAMYRGGLFLRTRLD